MKRRVIIITISILASATAYADSLGCLIRCKDKGLSNENCEYICND